MHRSFMAGLASVAALGHASNSLVPLQANDFQPFKDYSGDLVFGGRVWIGQNGAETQVLNWHLTGLDPMCNSTFDPTGEECGIRVTKSKACSRVKDAEYSEDVWDVAHYVSNIENEDYQVERVTTGKSLNHVGHTIVLFDSSGEIVACSVLEEVEIADTGVLGTGDFEQYVNYTGDLVVSGDVYVTETGKENDTAQVINFALQGVDPVCANPPSDEGACGISIYTGTDCDEDVGDRYYAADTDPWIDTQYIVLSGVDEVASTGQISTRKGADKFMSKGDDHTWVAGSVTVPVETGLALEDLVGHAVVVHAASGERIACAILKKGGAAMMSMLGLVVAISVAFAMN